MLSTASLSFRALVSPKEHGSWSFAFEPVLLGLLVAPSVPGLFLAGAVAHAFFVRRPLKLAVTLPDGDERRRSALRWTAILTTFTLIGFIGAAMLASRMALCPLLLCVPFGAIFLWFDLRNVAREAPAELSGSSAFALLPATFATLAGWSVPTALGLAALMLTRSFPTVLTVRTYVRRAKGQPVHPARALAGATASFAVVAALGLVGMVPRSSVLLASGLLLRAIIFLTALRPAWSAKQLGQSEALIGILYVSGITFGYHFGF